MNLYETLGIAANASAAEIKKAYRKMSKGAHPDAGGSTEAFHSLSTALAVLSDPLKRARYDETGTIDETVNDTDAGALTIISALVDTALTDEDAKHWDLVASMSKEIAKGIVAKAEAVTGMRKDEKRVVDLLARFSAKKLNRIAPLIERQLGRCRAAIVAAEQEALEMARAIEMLADHNFRVEPRPAPTPEPYAALSGFDELRRGFGSYRDKIDPRTGWKF